MKVKLLANSDLKMCDSAIGQCYDKGCYTEPEKIIKRIDNIGNVYKHNSILEFIDYNFEITACTKVLLEMTRHRMASYACKSSRYTLNKGVVEFENTGDPEVDIHLARWKEVVEDMIALGKPNDITSMMLPQSFVYRWQVKINARSLQNFMKLRLNKRAHYKIREVAEAMYNSLPEDHKFLYKDPESTEKEKNESK